VLILALDTSSPAGSLAVLRDEKVIGVVSTWAEEIFSSRMFRQLEFLMGELSLTLDKMDLFAVAAGPGSFTGLRVGLTAAKGWAEVYGKPIAAASALEAVAIQAHSQAPFVVPVTDARRGQVYFGLYRRIAGSARNELALEGDECAATPAEFLETVRARAGNSEFTIATPTPEVISDVVSRIETAQPRVERVSNVLAPLIGQLGFHHAQQGKLFDALSLDANYVRRSDAEAKWKEQ
jgi:tRNA threonylcarbamoyladenosine biosynthesis protein TsaB